MAVRFCPPRLTRSNVGASERASKRTNANDGMGRMIGAECVYAKYKLCMHVCVGKRPHGPRPGPGPEPSHLQSRTIRSSIARVSPFHLPPTHATLLPPALPSLSCFPFRACVFIRPVRMRERADDGDDVSSLWAAPPSSPLPAPSLHVRPCFRPCCPLLSSTPYLYPYNTMLPKPVAHFLSTFDSR